MFLGEHTDFSFDPTVWPERTCFRARAPRSRRRRSGWGWGRSWCCARTGPAGLPGSAGVGSIRALRNERNIRPARTSGRGWTSPTIIGSPRTPLWVQRASPSWRYCQAEKWSRRSYVTNVQTKDRTQCDFTTKFTLYNVDCAVTICVGTLLRANLNGVRKQRTIVFLRQPRKTIQTLLSFVAMYFSRAYYIRRPTNQENKGMVMNYKTWQ